MTRKVYAHSCRLCGRQFTGSSRAVVCDKCKAERLQSKAGLNAFTAAVDAGLVSEEATT